MARRSAMRHGTSTAAYEDAAGARAGLTTDNGGRSSGSWGLPDGGNGRGKPVRRGGRWRGSGGRWWVWVGRAILWAFIIVVLVNGIQAPFERFTAEPRQGATAAPKQDAKAQFPAAAASAYALQFANIYLN